MGQLIFLLFLKSSILAFISYNVWIFVKIAILFFRISSSLIISTELFIDSASSIMYFYSLFKSANLK